MALPVLVSSRAVLTGHTDSVFDLAFAPDGSFLASASRDGTVRVWSGPELDVSRELAPGHGMVTGVAVSPVSCTDFRSTRSAKPSDWSTCVRSPICHR